MICLLAIGKMEVSHGNKLNFKLGQTMKKIFILMASAAVMFAASCNKMEEVNTPVEPVVETELITIDLNPVTKTSLDGKATVWTEGDEVSVTVGGKNIGSLKLVKGTTSTFSGEVEAGKTGAATLNYPAGETSVPTTQAAVAGSFANGAALLEGTTTMDALRAGEGAQLSNTTALLQFSVAQAGDVTFEVGTTKYTVTGCQTGNTYYACVAPSANVSFTARIGGYLSKKASKNVTFAANKISNLDELPAPEASGWCLKGSFDNWKEGFSLFNDLNGNIVAKNIKLSGAFKIVNPSDKYVRSISNAPTTSKWLTLYDASGDMSLTGTYDVYVNTENKAICVVTVSSSVPEFKLSNRELYVSVQSGWGWPYLYGWEGTNTELWGGWQTRKYDTSLTISNTGYYCWMVPANFNNKTVSLIASKSGEQAPTKSGVTLTQDRFYELKYTNKVEFNEVTAPTF